MKWEGFSRQTKVFALGLVLATLALAWTTFAASRNPCSFIPQESAKPVSGKSFASRSPVLRRISLLQEQDPSVEGGGEGSAERLPPGAPCFAEMEAARHRRDVTTVCFALLLLATLLSAASDFLVQWKRAKQRARRDERSRRRAMRQREEVSPLGKDH
jgi:hypothetical protein